MLDLLLNVASYSLENVALPVFVTLATVKLAKSRAVSGDVAYHDRRALEISEDLRRWIGDRDRNAAVWMDEITSQAVANGVAAGGSLRAGAGKVYRHALHEYRDRASAAQREFDALHAAEGRAHARWRRYRGRPLARLVLAAESRALLADWRDRAEDDPSCAELEPRLAELEGLRLVAPDVSTRRASAGTVGRDGQRQRL